MKPLAEQTFYELLDVPNDASAERIEQAFEKASQFYGPESLATYTLADGQEARQLLERIEEAYLTLSDPELRRTYDAGLGLGAPVSLPAAEPSPAAPAPASQAGQLAFAPILDAVRVFPWPGSCPEDDFDEATPTPSSEASPSPAVQAFVGAATGAPAPFASIPDDADESEEDSELPPVRLSTSKPGDEVAPPAAPSAPESEAVSPSNAPTAPSPVPAEQRVAALAEPAPAEPMDDSVESAEPAIEAASAAPASAATADASAQPAIEAASAAPASAATADDSAQLAIEAASAALASAATADDSAQSAIEAAPVEPVQPASAQPVAVPQVEVPPEPAVAETVAAAPAETEPADEALPEESPAAQVAEADALQPSEPAPAQPELSEPPAATAAAAAAEVAIIVRPGVAPAVARAAAEPARAAPEPVVEASPPKVEEPKPPARVLPRMPDLPPNAVFNGELLRRVREGRGLSARDLADRTKIGLTHLENIEADRYEALPVPVYLRGFLMLIARELKLDPLKVSKSFLEQVARHGGKKSG